MCCGEGVLEINVFIPFKDSCFDEAETLSNFCLTKNLMKVLM